MSNKLFAFGVDTITDPDSWKGSFGPEKGIKNELQLDLQNSIRYVINICKFFHRKI